MLLWFFFGDALYMPVPLNCTLSELSVSCANELFISLCAWLTQNWLMKWGEICQVLFKCSSININYCTSANVLQKTMTSIYVSSSSLPGHDPVLVSTDFIWQWVWPPEKKLIVKTSFPELVPLCPKHGCVCRTKLSSAPLRRQKTLSVST